MKKIDVLLFLAFAAILIAVGAAIKAQAEEPYSVTLTTSMAKIVPDRGIRLNGGTFTAGATNTQGQVISNSVGRLYMVLVAGTNGVTAPTHSSGTASNGSTTYYRVREEKRRSVVIVNSGTNNASVGIGYQPDTDTDGIVLNASGGSLTLDEDIQDAVYGGTNTTFSIQEF